MKFKVGDRVLYANNHKFSGTITKVTRAEFDHRYFTYGVLWDHSAFENDGWQKNHLNLIMEPNDIMKELCSK